MKKEKYNVAVVGATGAVGNEMVSILEQRNFPVDRLKLLASTRGAGTRMEFQGKVLYRGGPERKLLCEESMSVSSLPVGPSARSLPPSPGKRAAW